MSKYFLVNLCHQLFLPSWNIISWKHTAAVVVDCGTDKWRGTHPDNYLQPAGVASVMFPAHLNYMLILAGSEAKSERSCKEIGKYKIGEH